MPNNFDLQLKWLNGSQIEIQENDGSSLTGVEKILVMQGGIAKEFTTQQVANLGGTSSYLVYSINLSQSSTNAPIGTPNQNTLGETPSLLYESQGRYSINTVAELFSDSSKVELFITQNELPTTASFAIKRIGIKQIEIYSYEPDGVGGFLTANGLLNNTTIEIRIYP